MMSTCEKKFMVAEEQLIHAEQINTLELSRIKSFGIFPSIFQ